jgi:hypothetical protein
MIKTLRITTVLAAFLAAGFFAFPVVFGYRGDEQIEQFLKSPGAVERFNKAKGAKVSKSKNQVSPLVKQAVFFGLYLNPPPAPAPKKRTPTARKAAAPSVPELPKAFSAKFTLIGTSYYSARPERSWAYIDEPGKGLHWVRQGSKVAHLLIEQVKDGSIVVKDRDKSVTLVAVRKPKKSLIKGENTAESAAALPGASASITSSVPSQIGDGKGPASVVSKASDSVKSGGQRQASARKGPASVLRKPPSATIKSIRRSEAEMREVAMMEKLAAELSAMEADAGAGKVDSQRSSKKGQDMLDKFISDLKAMRVSPEEAKRLDRLGKELKNVQPDPNRAGSSKIERSRLRPPRRPPR